MGIQDSKPVEFVGQMKDAAQFYANRVVKEFKDRYVAYTPVTAGLHQPDM